MFKTLKIVCTLSVLSFAGSMNATAASNFKSSVGHNVKQQAKKVYQVTASDQKGMRFEFSPTLESTPIRAGDTVTFIVKNTGYVEHEFGIDSEKATKKLSAETMKNPMKKHVQPNIVSVKPQETKKITWKFSGSEKVYFSCTLPGHFAAGMYKSFNLAP